MNIKKICIFSILFVSSTYVLSIISIYLVYGLHNNFIFPAFEDCVTEILLKESVLEHIDTTDATDEQKDYYLSLPDDPNVCVEDRIPVIIGINNLTRNVLVRISMSLLFSVFLTYILTSKSNNKKKKR